MYKGDFIMDALLLALSNVAEQLLPILGGIALILLCVLLYKLWGLVDQLTITVKEVDPTLKKVDESIEKVQAPLDTAVKLSKSLDKMGTSASDTFNKATRAANDSVDTLKDKVKNHKPHTKVGETFDAIMKEAEEKVKEERQHGSKG